MQQLPGPIRSWNASSLQGRAATVWALNLLTMAVKSIFARPWDLFCVLWFVTHLPTSLLIDSQIIMPPELLQHFPSQLKQMLQWHIATNGDHLVRDKPVWFVATVYCEIFLQVPFFLVAMYAYIAGCNWIRIPAIMYGVHAATTVVPMLADFYLGAGAHNPNQHLLLAMYGMYLLVPLLISFTMAFSRIPFPAAKKKKVA